MTTSWQKAIGSAAERAVAGRFKNGKRVGMDGGLVDVIAPPFAFQVKCLTTPLSINEARRLMARMPDPENSLRGVVLISRPGRGAKAVRTVIFDLDEFSEWYG